MNKLFFLEQFWFDFRVCFVPTVTIIAGIAVPDFVLSGKISIKFKINFWAAILGWVIKVKNRKVQTKSWH